MPDAYDCLLQVIRERFDAIDTKGAQRARDALTCPESQLAHLGWSRGLDYWSSSWSVEQQRAVINLTPANMRIRGTGAAIDAALAVFLSDIQIEEWWQQEPEGDPGTGQILVEQGSALEVDADTQELILRLLAREGRRAMHWVIVTAVLGADAVGDESRLRAASLYQYSGVQTGA